MAAVAPIASTAHPHSSEVEKKLFIVDDDPSRIQSLESIISFLGHAPVITTREKLRQLPSSAGSFSGFIVGRCGSQAKRQELVAEILHRDKCASVFTLNLTDEDGNSRPEQVRSSDRVFSVEYPLQQENFAQALERAQSRCGAQHSAQKVKPMRLFRALVGRTQGMDHVRHLIQQVAPTDASVLILGETGTGKEIVARNIHYHSERSDRPFVAVNCGAIPADLLESELFGHEKGAFTGAVTARQGRFELANGGTLFLDEIGDMPLPMQVKLLRVLQEQKFERVGGTKSISVDVRVISATHRDLEAQITKERFREDLFYRLNVFPIEMPPLRERMEDLPLLIGELTARLKASGKGYMQLTADAVEALGSYSWPGNVRELANLVERLTIMYPQSVVDVRDLPRKFLPEGLPERIEAARPPMTLCTPVPTVDLQPGLPPEGMDLRNHLSKLEISLINQALDDTGGIVAQAANRLGMRRTTLVEKMRKYNIQRQEKASDI